MSVILGLVPRIYRRSIVVMPLPRIGVRHVWVIPLIQCLIKIEPSLVEPFNQLYLPLSFITLQRFLSLDGQHNIGVPFEPNEEPGIVFRGEALRYLISMLHARPARSEVTPVYMTPRGLSDIM